MSDPYPSEGVLRGRARQAREEPGWDEATDSDTRLGHPGADAEIGGFLVSAQDYDDDAVEGRAAPDQYKFGWGLEHGLDDDGNSLPSDTQSDFEEFARDFAQQNKKRKKKTSERRRAKPVYIFAQLRSQLAMTRKKGPGGETELTCGGVSTKNVTVEDSGLGESATLGEVALVLNVDLKRYSWVGLSLDKGLGSIRPARVVAVNPELVLFPKKFSAATGYVISVAAEPDRPRTRRGSYRGAGAAVPTTAARAEVNRSADRGGGDSDGAEVNRSADRRRAGASRTASGANIASPPTPQAGKRSAWRPVRPEDTPQEVGFSDDGDDGDDVVSEFEDDEPPQISQRQAEAHFKRPPLKRAEMAAHRKAEPAKHAQLLGVAAQMLYLNAFLHRAGKGVITQVSSLVLAEKWMDGELPGVFDLIFKSQGGNDVVDKDALSRAQVHGELTSLDWNALLPDGLDSGGGGARAGLDAPAFMAEVAAKSAAASSAATTQVISALLETRTPDRRIGAALTRAQQAERQCDETPPSQSAPFLSKTRFSEGGDLSKMVDGIIKRIKLHTEYVDCRSVAAKLSGLVNDDVIPSNLLRVLRRMYADFDRDDMSQADEYRDDLYDFYRENLSSQKD